MASGNVHLLMVLEKTNNLCVLLFSLLGKGLRMVPPNKLVVRIKPLNICEGQKNDVTQNAELILAVINVILGPFSQFPREAWKICCTTMWTM